jgi:acyl dehydratase
MALDPKTVGFATQKHALRYDWKTLATYALGIGATRDELAYVYEGTPDGMRVYPTFAVVPAHAAILEALIKTGGDLAMIVHGGQTVRSFGTIPQEGVLETVGKIDAIYDMKKFAQVILSTDTRLGDRTVYTTTWSIIFRGAGGFGGERPPSDDAPSVPKEQAPAFRWEQATTPEQALLYRISGDQNPLHADPAFAERVGFPQGPILHGLCTFGFLGRAAVKHACGGDPTKLRRLSAQFRKPVWPGDTLAVEGHDLGAGKFAFATQVKERNEAVLGGAWAEVGEL